MDVLIICTEDGFKTDWTKLISDHLDTYQLEISIRNPIQANVYLASIALPYTSRERRVEDSNQINHNLFTIHKGYIGKDSKFVVHTISSLYSKTLRYLLNQTFHMTKNYLNYSCGKQSV